MRKTTVYDGRILGLSVYEGEIEGRSVRREVVEHRGASAVLAIDGGKLVMVKQHRFPHGYVLEIPAGTLERGEDPRACAFRELREETGYSARGMAHLITFYPSIGYNTEAIHCYVASGLKAPETSSLDLDDDEILSVHKVSLGRVMQMIRSGRIQDSKTICTMMTYASKKRLY